MLSSAFGTLVSSSVSVVNPSFPSFVDANHFAKYELLNTVDTRIHQNIKDYVFLQCAMSAYENNIDQLSRITMIMQILILLKANLLKVLAT